MDRSGCPVSSEAIPRKHYIQMCIQLNGLKGTCEHAPQLKKWNLRGHMWKNLSLHNQRKRLGRQKIHLEIFKWKLKTFKLSIFHVLIERSQCPYFDMTIQKKKPIIITSAYPEEKDGFLQSGLNQHLQPRERSAWPFEERTALVWCRKGSESISPGFRF